MIFTVITCDRCNPTGNLRDVGALERCTWIEAYEDFGWRRIGGKHVCQGCQKEEPTP